MCLILFAHKAHPDYKLIVIANRDEFYKRPTAQADWWSLYPNMLAGKDLVGQGSWFGINKQGKFAALTNYRDGLHLKKNAPTRGTLVTDFLTTEITPQSYLTPLRITKDDYNGYNLLIHDGESMFHYSNIDDEIHELSPGVYGLCNHLLDTPWPKVKRGKAALKNLIAQKNFSISDAFEALLNDVRPPDEDLPNTGVPLEWEQKLSSICIRTENYGTRCSSVLLMDYDDNIYFEERSYVPKADSKIYKFKKEMSLTI